MKSYRNRAAKMAPAFRSALLGWFSENARSMPWRETRDPYRIWLSEVMLQQTRVDQVRPYYDRFVERFPTVDALAAAELDEVLKSWEGLGYYSRARNMHRAARTVAEQFSGVFPGTYETLLALPGVGPYTAAAVASIAFGEKRAVLDGNVARVLARIFAIPKDIKSTGAKRTLQDAANALIDPEAPGDFNEAIMELGAVICTPAAPHCPSCPVRGCCEAFEKGRVNRYPVTSGRAPVPHFDIAVGIIVDHAGNVLIARRPEDGLLGGLWEFPGGKREEGEALPDTCRREIAEETGLTVEVGDHCLTLSHAYTHFRITMHAFWCRPEGDPAVTMTRPAEWVPFGRLSEFAFPRANRRLIEHIMEKKVTRASSAASDLSH